MVARIAFLLMTAAVPAALINVHRSPACHANLQSPYVVYHVKMALTAGTKLGPYEIAALIGSGGMGEVYRAKDTRLDRMVAIKILPAHLSEDPDLKQRFEREARTISSLSHPNICALHDIGHHDGID